MEKLPGDIIYLESIDSVSNDDQAAIYPLEFLNSINISGLPLHELKLKIGAPIMPLRILVKFRTLRKKKTVLCRS